MQVKFVLPALAEAKGPYWRSLKYSLMPPLGLATLAAYLGPDDEATLEDEHVQPVTLDDRPDVVALEVYVTSASGAYQLADEYRRRGCYVCLGGLHVTACPSEAAAHADSIFLGPGEEAWPRFLADFRAGRPEPVYRSRSRSLAALPPLRRDLIARERYLFPNSLVVSRGCPHHCDFCYKDAFYAGGRGYYTQPVDAALAEIERLPGRHLYFLDDHLFGNSRFAAALFDGLRGMGRLWQAAATITSVLRGELLERAVAGGLRSLFLGFETLDGESLAAHNKQHNVGRDYAEAVHRLHALGVMVNGSFIFGCDEHDASVFERTVDWAVAQGVETATFHILTPYPGTRLYDRLAAEGRLLHRDWDRYDTRHAVFQPARMTPDALEAGYRRAYGEFYGWRNLWRGASAKPTLPARLRHLAYAGAWKKCDGLWHWIIRAGAIGRMVPLLEAVLAGGARPERQLDPARSAAAGG